MSIVITSPLNKSFVNLLGNDLWTEADIVNKTEAELHSVVSKDDELILSRKMIGFSLGRVIPTMEEQAQLMAYETAALAAQQSGIAARADMALLRSAMDVEPAIARLVLPAITEPVSEEITLEDGTISYGLNYQIPFQDAAERTAAQAAVDAASPEVLTLVALRNPTPTEDPE